MSRADLNYVLNGMTSSMSSSIQYSGQLLRLSESLEKQVEKLESVLTQEDPKNSQVFCSYEDIRVGYYHSEKNRTSHGPIWLTDGTSIDLCRKITLLDPTIHLRVGLTCRFLSNYGHNQEFDVTGELDIEEVLSFFHKTRRYSREVNLANRSDTPTILSSYIEHYRQEQAAKVKSALEGGGLVPKLNYKGLIQNLEKTLETVKDLERRHNLVFQGLTDR